ncbi:hypothetical protein M758_12G114300 [Ceratodon purpureus]|nr:hypothetical protein M758_12G114300 [Ceratodon purpureus]
MGTLELAFNFKLLHVLGWIKLCSCPSTTFNSCISAAWKIIGSQGLFYCMELIHIGRFPL